MKRKNVKIVILTAGILMGLAAVSWFVKVEDHVDVEIVTASMSLCRGVRARAHGSIIRMVSPFGSMVNEGDTVMIYARFDGRIDTVVAPIAGRVVDRNPEMHSWGLRMEDEMLFDIISSERAPRSQGYCYVSAKERDKLREGQEIVFEGRIDPSARVKAISTTPDREGRYRVEVSISAWGEGIPEEQREYGAVSVEKTSLLERLSRRDRMAWLLWELLRIRLY